MTDMWRRAQPWCEKLRRAGRLESVAGLLGISCVNEFHPSDDVEYYVARCARVAAITERLVADAQIFECDKP